MKFKLQAYSIYEVGKRVDAQGNPHQEDSMFPMEGALTPSDRLFILCDGMGGHDAGEVASATVCKAMARSINATLTDSEALFTDAMLQQAVADAYDALDTKDTGAVKKMGTTMTFLKLHAGGATIAHMGDSRVYHIRPGQTADDTQILFVTRDHSLVNDLVKAQILTPEEARTSPQKNIITRAMQPHMERRHKADIYHTADIRPGDYFYLCSDGMLEQMEDDNIRFNFSAMTGDDANKVHVLTEATRFNRDNHTAIIVHILDVEGAPEQLPQEEPTAVGMAAAPVANAPTDGFEVEAEDDDSAPTAESTAIPQRDGEATAAPTAHATDQQRRFGPSPALMDGNFASPSSATRQGPKSKYGGMMEGLLGKRSGHKGKDLYMLLGGIIVVVALLLFFYPKGKRGLKDSKLDEIELRDADGHGSNANGGRHRHSKPSATQPAAQPTKPAAPTKPATKPTAPATNDNPTAAPAAPGKTDAQPQKQEGENKPTKPSQQPPKKTEGQSHEGGSGQHSGPTTEHLQNA